VKLYIQREPKRGASEERTTRELRGKVQGRITEKPEKLAQEFTPTQHKKKEGGKPRNLKNELEKKLENNADNRSESKGQKEANGTGKYPQQKKRGNSKEKAFNEVIRMRKRNSQGGKA